MPLPDAATNVVIQIWRPDDDEFGGNRSAQLMHRDVGAFFQEASEFVRTSGSPTRERVIKGLLVLDAYTDDGDVIDVQAGDEVRFEDYRGVELKREVVLVTPNHVLGAIDTLHVEVE
ncbi:MAG: hypothetical protein V3U63_01645 [Gemmatimonadota bacterium]